MAIVNKFQEGGKNFSGVPVMQMYPNKKFTLKDRQEVHNLGIENAEDLKEYLLDLNKELGLNINPEAYELQEFIDDNSPNEVVNGVIPFYRFIILESNNPGSGISLLEKYAKQQAPYKKVNIKKSGGSILDQLKEQLPELEIFDLLQHFGIDDILNGGLKDTGSVSIQIVIDGNSSDEDKKVPDLKEIELGDNTYKVEIADTPEAMEKGLSGRKSLGENEGMLFDFKEVQPEVSFWMKDTYIPLDIIFINGDDEVVKVYKGEPEDETLITVKNIRYVVELNQNSGIEKGDDFDFDPKDDGPIMKVLAPDGSTQMELKGGERIFSRKNTRTLIRMAKRANKSKSDSDYRKLGKRMFSYIHTQDTNTPEYVEVPEN